MVVLVVGIGKMGMAVRQGHMLMTMGVTLHG